MWNKAKALYFVSAIALSSSNVICREWKLLTQKDESGLIAAETESVDGGQLIVSCY